jgi:hypothetical protein
MDLTQSFIIGVLILLIYLVLAFTYHVYKLELLIKQLFNDRLEFDEVIEELDFKGGRNNRCKNCNRNDNTCGCN